MTFPDFSAIKGEFAPISIERRKTGVIRRRVRIYPQIRNLGTGFGSGRLLDRGKGGGGVWRCLIGRSCNWEIHDFGRLRR
jgi:hypothetical protein